MRRASHCLSSPLLRLLLLVLGFTLSSSMLMAQDLPVVHRVTLNPNSGTVNPAYLELVDGQPFGVLPTPIREGFTFAGWYKTPGREETRVTPRKIYTYAVYNDIIIATWTKKTARLTFMNFDGTTQIGTLTISGQGGSFLDIPAETYKLATADDKFFAGYFTRINGEGERIYSGVAGQCPPNDPVLIPAIDEPSSYSTSSNTLLYAHQIHVKHSVTWDYSYDASESAGESAWMNVSKGDDARIKYGRLTFKDNAGNVLKSIYFKANDVDDRNDVTSAFSTHTVTTGQFYLQLASDEHPETPDDSVIEGSTPETKGNAGTWNVYFTDEQLSHFAQYEFEPISWDGATGEKALASTWIRTTDKENHSTIFSFVGGSAANVAPIHWTVRLQGLRVYPDVVIAKPLFKNSSGEWEEITQLAHVEGIRCERTDNASDPSFATYEASYPVWKLDANDHSYINAIGMTAFEIQGQTHYLNKTAPGSFSAAFNSANSQVGGDTKTSLWHSDTQQFDNIFYTIQASEIPVVHFIADPAKGEQLTGNTPMYLWGTQGETITNFGTKYQATRPGFSFLGWEDAAKEPAMVYGPDATFTYNGAYTFTPVWHEHVFGALIPAKDPTAAEVGSVVAYKVCEQCGIYAFEDGREMTPAEIAQNIIPAGSVLVKNDEGETTRWADEVNRAIEKINAAEHTGNNILLTKDANVETSTIRMPSSRVTIDLNGHSLMAANGLNYIMGNSAIDILLKDDGYTEYTNQSQVYLCNIKYHRSFAAATRAGKWQALYLPFSTSYITAPAGVEYTIGTPEGVEITAETAKLIINKDINRLEQFKPYFIKSSNGEVVFSASSTLLSPYRDPEADKVMVSENYTFKGSLKATDNVATVDQAYWILTNGGKFTWAAEGSHQRPYHWVICNESPANAKPTILTIVETGDELAGINDRMTAEEGANTQIYNLSGQRMPTGAALPSGVYIVNGQKVYVK